MIILNKTINYIHIPKTGGGTINHTLLKFVKDYKQIHNHDLSNKININKQLLLTNNPFIIYVISIRNPIKRFISAFYHMYKNNINNFTKKCDKYNIININTFLDKIFISNTFSINKEIYNLFNTGHLKLGFYEYLNEFLSFKNYNNIVVLLQENLDKELNKKLKIYKQNIYRGQEHSFIPEKIIISEFNLKRLKLILEKD